MPEILYLMGTARSGSTILEILLAANAGYFGAGEISHVFQDGFLDDGECACGRPASRCEVWGAVLVRLGWRREEIREAARIVRRIEGHAAFPRLLLGLFPRRVLSDYRQAQQRVFEGLAAITGARTVVDSSKYAGRALALARVFPGRVRVIALTRSPEGLLAAFRRPNPDEQKPKSTLAAMLYYLYVATAIRIALAVLGKRALALRYEALRADPEGVLERIGQWCGGDFSVARRGVAQGEAFDVGHIVTGNRLRKAGSVRFEKREAPTGDPELSGRMAAAVMNAYRALLRL